MKIIIAAAAASLFAAMAVVTAPVASAGPEERFLDTIDRAGIVWEPVDTLDVIETGHAVCTDWENGADFEQEVADLQRVTDWTDYQVGAFIGASTGAFCPEYEFILP